MLKLFRQIQTEMRGFPLCNNLFSVITSGFIGLMLLVAFSFSVSYQTLMSVENLVGGIVGSSNKKMELIYNLERAAQERVIKLNQMVREPDVSVRNAIKKDYGALLQQMMNDRHRLEKYVSSEKEKRMMVALISAHAAINVVQDKVLDDLSRGRSENTIALLSEVEKKQDGLNQIFAQYLMFEEGIRQDSSAEIKTVFDESAQWMVYLSILIFFVAFLVSVFIVLFVTGQQRKLIEMNSTLESYNNVLRLSAIEAERENKAKLEFIDNLSHELRTPLTTIKGSLGILNSGMIDNVPEEAKKLISMADQNSDGLISLLNDVLDFSKLEANEVEIVKNNFDIHREIEHFLIPFYKKARNKSLNLEVMFSDRLPLSVKLDPQYLFQILTQLIGNAIKFTQEGDVFVQVDYVEGVENIVFHIIDTGVGFDETDIRTLFDSFVQGDGSSTRHFGGTGIGLAICKKLSDALKGEITVSSDKDKGSTFSLSLPAEIDIAA